MKQIIEEKPRIVIGAMGGLVHATIIHAGLPEPLKLGPVSLNEENTTMLGRVISNHVNGAGYSLENGKVYAGKDASIPCNRVSIDLLKPLVLQLTPNTAPPPA